MGAPNAEAYARPAYKWIGARQFLYNRQGWCLSLFPGGIGFSLSNYSDEKALRVRLNVFREDGTEEIYLSDAYYCGEWGDGWQKWQTDRLPLFPYESLHGRARYITFSYNILKEGSIIPSRTTYRFATLEDFHAGLLPSDDFDDPAYRGDNGETVVHDKTASCQAAYNKLNQTGGVAPEPFFTRGNPAGPDHPVQEIHRAIDRVIRRKEEDPAGRHYIRLAMFDLDNEHITKHLVYAKERGVDVVCVGDWAQVAPLNASEHIARLRLGGVPVFGVVRNDPLRLHEDLASMHAKIMLFDGHEAHCASYNLHFHLWGGNWENVLVDRSPDACRIYEGIYRAIRYGSRLKLRTTRSARCNIYYSFGFYGTEKEPYRAYDAIITEIEEARVSVVACMFDISSFRGKVCGDGRETDVIDALIRARDRGVRVRLFLNGMASHEGTLPAAWDKTFPRPLKHPLLRLKDTWIEICHVYYHESVYSPLHHKFAVIDDRTVIAGSCNWYEPSLSSDEVVTIVRDEKVARAFLEETELLVRSFRVERE